MRSKSRGNIALRSIVAAADGQVSCTLAGEVAILNLESGVYYGLDETGAAIWDLLARPRRVSEIRDDLLGRYDVDRNECTDDLIALLDRLAARGLIRVCDEPGASIRRA
jgi:Coenzyme PQQ synthesis protein D (PqqD)